MPFPWLEKKEELTTSEKVCRSISGLHMGAPKQEELTLGERIRRSMTTSPDHAAASNGAGNGAWSSIWSGLAKEEERATEDRIVQGERFLGLEICGSAAMAPQDDAAEADSAKHGEAASVWSAFRDRRHRADRGATDAAVREDGAAQDAARGEDHTKKPSLSWFFLNEELRRVESRASPTSRQGSSRQGPSRQESSRQGSCTSDVEDKDKDDVTALSGTVRQGLELRERSLPDRWLDFFCIVGLAPGAHLAAAAAEDGEGGGAADDGLRREPVLLDRYPNDRDDAEFPKHLPTFCFPDGRCRPLRYPVYRESKSHRRNDAPDPRLHSMVLTSGSGHRLYCTTLTIYEMREDKPQAGKKSVSKVMERMRDGGCAVATSNTEEEYYYWMVPKCLVLMSHYPFFQAQSSALKALFHTVNSGASPLPFERYVAHLLNDVPLPRSGVGREDEGYRHTVVEWMSWIRPAGAAPKVPPTIRLEQPPPNRLPLLDVSMEPLFRTLSLSNILVIWGALLGEGKVVLSASCETIALLCPIAEALLALLFPLEWQGLYVPVLSNHRTVSDVLQAPVPYLIGLVTQTYDPQSHPNGVLWCDLDNDALHLGFKDDLFDRDNEAVSALPPLPSDAVMTLKAELEELADPLYLPTADGIKGRITVGDRTVELDNARREPYAQRTKLFAAPTGTPRTYILTQSSMIPPREKALNRDDFCFARNEKTEKKVAASENEAIMCGLLEDINIPCDENVVCIDATWNEQEEKKENGNAAQGRKQRIFNFERGSNAMGEVGRVCFQYAEQEQKVVEKEVHVEPGNQIEKEPGSEEAPTAIAMNQDPTLLVSMKRQGRSVQAHVDRALAVLGQNYATPSEYATRSSQHFPDLLSQQDDIAAQFFTVDQRERHEVIKRVRASFLRFFLVVFARYEFFCDKETNRLDEGRFVMSLNLPQCQREYMKEVVTSQMFDRFLHDADSVRHRKLFGEYITQRAKGGSNKAPDHGGKTPLLDSSRWQNPVIVVPAQPCCVGSKEGLIYCRDRRFPDNLDPSECITNQSVSFWKRFWDGAFCFA